MSDSTDNSLQQEFTPLTRINADQDYSVEEVDVSGADDSDWMMNILKNTILQELPTEYVPQILMQFEPIEVKQGEIIIKQGDVGDYFYFVHQGECRVTYRSAPSAEEKQVNHLVPGRSFGEEALISGATRSGTVTMLSNGVLFRLSKAHFQRFISQSLLTYATYPEVENLPQPVVWLDNSPADLYTPNPLLNTINTPAELIRNYYDQFQKEVTYIVIGNDRGQCASTAFLLQSQGFQVYLLKGDVPKENTGEIETTTTESIETKLAEALKTTQALEKENKGLARKMVMLMRENQQLRKALAAYKNRAANAENVESGD